MYFLTLSIRVRIPESGAYNLFYKVLKLYLHMAFFTVPKKPY